MQKKKHYTINSFALSIYSKTPPNDHPDKPTTPL